MKLLVSDAERQRVWRTEHPDACREHSRKYYAANRERILAKKYARFRKFQEWLRILTGTYRCEWCGGEASDWHHVDPATKRCDVAGMDGYSLDSIEAELVKCIPLCKECHGTYHRKGQLA
jgi:hypothetical protein